MTRFDLTVRCWAIGALAGILTGAVLGTIAWPLVGTLAGAVLGLPIGFVLGVVEGFVLVPLARYGRTVVAAAGAATAGAASAAVALLVVQLGVAAAIACALGTAVLAGLLAPWAVRPTPPGPRRARELRQATRITLAGASGGAVLAGAFAAGVGFHAHPATMWFAALEGLLAGAVGGGLLGLFGSAVRVGVGRLAHR